MFKYFVLVFSCITAVLFGEMKNVDYSLYLVTYRGDKSVEWLLDAVEKAVQGGVSVVQFDEPTLSTPEFIRVGKQLHARLAPYHVPLIINKRVDVAKAVGAEGVNLMKADVATIASVRRELGPDVIIGLAAGTSLEAAIADHDVDYISIGPVFPSKTHPEIIPWGVDGFEKVRALCSKPLIGVGGVRKNNAAELIRAGADGIVVVSAILNAPDPLQAAAELREIIENAR